MEHLRSPSPDRLPRSSSSSSSSAFESSRRRALSLWLGNGSPRYDGVSYHIVFLSDVGAHYYAAFVTCAAVTAGLFFIGLLCLVLRWLGFHADSGVSFRCRRCRGCYRSYQGCVRHCFSRDSTPPTSPPAGLTPAAQFKLRLLLKSVALPTALLLSIFLILTGVSKITTHQSSHVVFTLGFILCALIYAFTILIDQWGTPPNTTATRGMTCCGGAGRPKDVAAAVLLSIAAALTLADAILYLSCHDRKGTSCDGVISTAAVIEWVLSFFFAFYLISEGVLSQHYAYGSNTTINHEQPPPNQSNQSRGPQPNPTSEIAPVAAV